MCVQTFEGTHMTLEQDVCMWSLLAEPHAHTFSSQAACGCPFGKVGTPRLRCWSSMESGGRISGRFDLFEIVLVDSQTM